MNLDPVWREIGEELKALDADRSPELTVEHLLRAPVVPMVFDGRAPTRPIRHIRWMSVAAALVAGVLLWSVAAPGGDPTVLDTPPSDRTPIAPMTTDSDSPPTSPSVSSTPATPGPSTTAELGRVTTAVSVSTMPMAPVTGIPVATSLPSVPAPGAPPSSTAITTTTVQATVPTTESTVAPGSPAGPGANSTTTTSASPPSPAPRAAWSFDRAGVDQFSSAGGFVLTLGDGVAQVPGRSGSALSLTGVHPVAAESVGPVIDTTLSFTVSAVIRAATLRDCLFQGFVSQDGATVSGFELGTTAGCSPDVAAFQFVMTDSDSDAATARRVTSREPVVAGQWYHVVAVHDAEAHELRLYVDGELAAVGPAPTTPWAATGRFAVGRARFSAQQRDYFAGTIDTISVYASALTDAEVAAL